MKKQTTKQEEKMPMNNVLFTEHFGIDKSQGEIEFVDIYVNTDRKFFLDPAKLLKYEDELSIKMSNGLVDYFARLLALIRSGNKTESLEMLKELREPQETHLGYARNGYAGNALGGIKGNLVYEKLSKSQAVQSGLLKDLEESALLVKGINRDIVSDMTVMITKGELIEFTQRQCRKYDVPVKKVKVGMIWNRELEKWEEREADLPVYNMKPIILVPKKIICINPTLNCQEFYNHEILDTIQDELMRADQSLVVVLKNGKRKCAITKKELKKDNKFKFSKELLYSMIQAHPHLLENYRTRKKYQKEDIDDKLVPSS